MFVKNSYPQTKTSHRLAESQEMKTLITWLYKTCQSLLGKSQLQQLSKHAAFNMKYGRRKKGDQVNISIHTMRNIRLKIANEINKFV